MDNKILLFILENVNTLPPLPAAVEKLCRLTENPDVDVRDVAWVISREPALTAQMLKVANSAFYGLSRRIITIVQAISILGFNGIKNLAIGIALSQYYKKPTAISAITREQLWRHSMAVAAAARLIALRIRFVDPEEAFIAGLIHDIGKLFFMEHFSKQYALVIEKVLKHGGMLHAVEKDELGINHAEVGSVLCEYWKLPSNLIAAVSDHHLNIGKNSLETKGERFVSVIKLANNLALCAQIGFSGDLRIEVDPDASYLEPEQCFQIMLTLPEEIHKSEALFEMGSNLDGEKQKS